MDGHQVAWKVPDFGRLVERDSILSRLYSGGNRLRLLTAPSGWGKTVVAAQLALRSRRRILWIDAYGQQISIERIAAEVLLRLSGESPGSVVREDVAERSLDDLVDACTAQSTTEFDADGLFVVVDDCVPEQSCGFRSMEALHARLAPAGIELTLTTRSAPRNALDRPERVTVVDASELAMCSAEVAELLAILPDAAAGSVEQLTSATQGHPALVQMLAHGSAGAADAAFAQVAEPVRTRVLSWLHCATASLSEHEVSWLRAISLLRSGNQEQLASLGLAKPEDFLVQMQKVIPFIRVSAPDGSGARRFSVHDLMESWIADNLQSGGCSQLPVTVERLGLELGEANDFVRGGRLVRGHCSEETLIDWLGKFGEPMLAAGHTSELDELLATIRLNSIIEHPGLLALWASVALAIGNPSDALRRSKTAAEVSNHFGEPGVAVECMFTWLEALKRLDRQEEAALVCSTLVDAAASLRDAGVHVRAETGAARCFCSMGRLDDAARAIGKAHVIAASDPACRDLRTRVAAYGAIIDCLKSGDYFAAIEPLTRCVAGPEAWLSERVLTRGNLVVPLIECGRVHRAMPLATYVHVSGDDYHRAAFAALLAQLMFALGEIDNALDLFSSANGHCAQSGAEYDLAVNRIYMSTCLRTLGRQAAALECAERAFERLSAMDFMGFRRLATLEIAASLLAMGDVGAARRWAEPVVKAGFDGNAYHALRAAMILAECDRRDGSLEVGVVRLQEHGEHIISESSNWQMAMYCRAFPELLGMLALAVGVTSLPVHMLRMVLPEYGERALVACRDWLRADDWRLLGRRVLGDSDFALLERRDGQPVCRVRLFGGLDVTVADRTLSERDWRKRKARLLFAMLVSRQGRDIAREQFFDHLWPDLPEAKARNNFYVVWSAMKSALMGDSTRSKACPYIENTGGRCRVVIDALRSDVDEFDEALALARAAEAADDTPTALGAYARLSMVYRGDLLPGDIYDDWFSDMRERYRFEFVDAMVRAGELLLGTDDPCEALTYVRRALQVDGVREDLYQMALRCQIAAGQRTGAIDTFIACRAKLSDELGLDPSAETMSLYQQILVMEDCPRAEDYGLG